MRQNRVRNQLRRAGGEEGVGHLAEYLETASSPLEACVDDGSGDGYAQHQHHQHPEHGDGEQFWPRARPVSFPQTRQCIAQAVADDFCCTYRLRQPAALLPLALPFRQPLPRSGLPRLPRPCDSPLAQEPTKIQAIARAGLDHHIPSRSTADKPDAEFQQP